MDYHRIHEPNYQPTIIDNPIALFREDSPWSVTVNTYYFSLQQLTTSGYPSHRNDLSAQYLLYEINQQLPSTHIHISQLTRQLGRWRMDYSLEDLLSGTPIYTTGKNLRLYMEKSIIPTPHSSIDKRNFATELYSNYGKPWTEDTLNTLVTLYQQGLTFSAISEQLGRAPWTIEQRLRKLRYAGRLTSSPTRQACTAKASGRSGSVQTPSVLHPSEA